MGSLLAIEVAYAGPEGQWLLTVAMLPGSSIHDAITASRIEERVPGLAIVEGHVGVFGNARPLATALRDGDRVEIYRPLLIDPKEARRARIPKR
jgi:putative ubiquitin-RnfH superfamily antitoxin RatB of RatAB toxin-antitoxin module